VPFIIPTTPPALNPQKKMGRNEKCWCGSNKKWKNCHNEKERKEPLKKSDAFSLERSSVDATAECLHPTKCPNIPISSHTIQKSVGLRAIAKNNHVMTFMAGMNGLNRNHGKLKATRKGIQSASTFPGFCEEHDGELFAPIEKKDWVNSKENAFLFSLRAVSYEVFSKKRALFSASYLQENADNGTEFDTQVEIQHFYSAYIHGLKWA